MTVPLPKDPRACRQALLNAGVPLAELEPTARTFCQQPSAWPGAVALTYNHERTTGPLPPHYSGANAPQLCIPDLYMQLVKRAANALYNRTTVLKGLGSLSGTTLGSDVPTGSAYNIEGKLTSYTYVPSGREAEGLKFGATKVLQEKDNANRFSAPARSLTNSGNVVTVKEDTNARCINNAHVQDGWFPIYDNLSMQGRVREGVFGRPQKDQYLYYMAAGSPANQCYPIGPFPVADPTAFNPLVQAQSWQRALTEVGRDGTRSKWFIFSRTWGVPTEDMKLFAKSSPSNAVLMMSPKTDAASRALSLFLASRRPATSPGNLNITDGGYWDSNFGWHPNWWPGTPLPLDDQIRRWVRMPVCSEAIAKAAEIEAARLSELERVRVETEVAEMVKKLEQETAAAAAASSGGGGQQTPPDSGGGQQPPSGGQTPPSDGGGQSTTAKTEGPSMGTLALVAGAVVAGLLLFRGK